MAKAFYRNTGTNQMVWVPVGFFGASPLWELVEGSGGGDVTQAELDAVEQDTTGPHGVADFALLETQASATHKVSDGIAGHAAADDPHGDRAYADTIVVADAVNGAELGAAITVHNNDTTGVHGIPDTQQLETIIGSAGKVATHAVVTTSVHGIANTALLALRTDLVINVRNYGALGDGSHDDTANITSAIAALPASGGVLFFPPASSFYSVTAGFSFSGRSNLAIRGDGGGAEIRFAAATTDTQYSSWPDYGKDSIFRFVDCDNVVVEGLTLNGNLSNRTGHATTESFNSCLTFAGCDRVTVRKCFITEGMTDGVIVMYNQGGTLSTRVSITDCSITKCRRNNVSLIGQDGATVADCLLDAAGTVQGLAPKAGLDIEPDGAPNRSKNVFVARNTITGNAGTYGLTVGGTGTAGLVVSGNSIVGNAVGGLNLESANSRVTVSDNIITGHTAGSGIRAIGAGVDLIKANQIVGNKFGVAATSSDHVSIVGNKLQANTYQGLVLTTFVNVLVAGNTFTDNTSAQGQTDGAGYAVYATRTDANSILLFNNNVLFSSAAAGTLMSGARVDAACNARANGNVGKHLRDDEALITNMSGRGNYSVDAEAGRTPGDVVLCVDDFGAVGDGSANDTAAIQAALDAAPTGGKVLLGPGKNYSVAGLTITNKSDFTFDGRGSELTYRATGARIGVQFVGTCVNVTVQNLVITGNTVVIDAHAGIYCGSGQNLENLKILNNRIIDVTLGISFSADGSGSLTNILIQGNHIENVVGTAGGTGYGLHHASSDTTSHQLVKFVNNTIIGASRHSIYQAKGQGIVIQGNTIRDHRIGVNDGSFLSAIMCARSGDVTINANVLSDGFDSAMTIGGVAGGTQARNYSVTGNAFCTPKDNIPLLIIGQQAPATDGYPDGVLVAGNTFYTTTNGPSVSLLSGKRVRISNNLFTSTITTGTTSGIRIGPLDETAGTALYTDDLVVEGNSIYMATGGTKLPLNITGAELTAIAMRFSGNRISTPGNIFQAPTTLTDPNVIVSGQPATGLTGPFLTEQANDVIRHPRIGGTTGTATPTPDTRVIEVYELTALNVNATFGAPTGTPADGQQLAIRIKDNGTARTLAWNAIYRAIGVTLPATTTISKTMYVGARYNSADSKWDVLSVLEEA